MPSLPQPLICIDANLLLQLLVEAQWTLQAEALWIQWCNSEARLIAPSLLYYEICNILHQYTRRNELVPEDAQSALEMVTLFNITFYDDVLLHYQAARLARTLQLPATYDAHYLALCEQYGAEFWTADKRLYNSVHDALPWVHLLQEYEADCHLPAGVVSP